MDDLIRRADAISVLDNFTQTDTLGHTPRQIVEALPSAQPTIKPRKGKWIFNMKRGTMKIWTCSECGWNDIGEWNFCPNCGADMREVTE